MERDIRVSQIIGRRLRLRISCYRYSSCYKRETTAVLLYDTDTMRKIAEFPVSDFIKFSNILLKTLISSKGTFSVPELTTFLNKPRLSYP